MKGQSDEQFTQQLNDKLNQLWTGAKKQRRDLINNKIPSYSRRNDLAQASLISGQTNGLIQKQVLKLREKLQSQVSAGKHKNLEIANLQKAILQLQNEKNFLLQQLSHQKQIQGNQNCSHTLNQSSIHNLPHNKKSDNSSSPQYLKKKQKHIHHKSKNNTSLLQQKNQKIQSLENLSKQRLIELLRSTSQYRSFVFYYDSHELSYLKRLNQQHKKNCTQSLSDKEKVFWAPTEIIHQIKQLNESEHLGLSQQLQQLLISRIKYFYEKNEEQRIKKIKMNYEQKLRKAIRSNQNGVPYDLVQVSKAKQREMARQSIGRKKTNTTLK